MNLHKYVAVGTVCTVLGGTGIAAAANTHHAPHAYSRSQGERPPRTARPSRPNRCQPAKMEPMASTEPTVLMALMALTASMARTVLRDPQARTGKKGPTGMSAYELYASTTTDSPVLSQSAWLKSLEG